MIQSLRLFVVWMIQTKKQTAGISGNHFTTGQDYKNRKHQKNRTQAFWCWQVEHRIELFVVWMIQNQTKKQLQADSYTFQHKNLFVRFKKNRFFHIYLQQQIKTNQNKRIELWSLMQNDPVSPAVCRLDDSNQKTNSQMTRLSFHNRTRLQKQKTSKEPKINKLSEVEKWNISQSCLSFGWFKTKRKTARKRRLLFNTKTFLFGSKNAFFHFADIKTRQKHQRSFLWSNVKQRVSLFSFCFCFFFFFFCFFFFFFLFFFFFFLFFSVSSFFFLSALSSDNSVKNTSSTSTQKQESKNLEISIGIFCLRGALFPKRSTAYYLLVLWLKIVLFSCF